MPLQVLSPMPGKVTDLSKVPDPMFAQAMLGPGVAIDPPRSRSPRWPPSPARS